MPLNATVYRVLIVSPSDVQKEREVAKDVIMRWNAVNSRQQGTYIEPIFWKTHVGKHLGQSPQQKTSEQMINDCDLVVGIFWSRVGDTTQIEETGAVEKVKTIAFDRGKPAIVGFCERDIQQDRRDVPQLRKLEAFETECEEAGLCFKYQSVEKFEKQLYQQLTHTMNQVVEDKPESDFTKKSKEDEVVSEYDPEVDHERLKLSSDTHREQDFDNLNDVVDFLNSRGIETPYRVLDAGCGYGTVTQDRFGFDDRFDVLAIDRVANILSVARNKYSAPNISYQQLDVNALHDADIGEFDIVVATYLFHHLENQEAVLAKLWNRVRSPGVLFIRSCDDGQHIHYPPDEEMDWLVEVTDEIKGSSDRRHGRRLYTHLRRLNPEPERINLDLRNYHTAGKGRREREQYWDVFHSNRLHYADVLAQRPEATDEDQQLYNRMKKRYKRLEEKFLVNNDFLDVKSVPLTLAYKA